MLQLKKETPPFENNIKQCQHSTKQDKKDKFEKVCISLTVLHNSPEHVLVFVNPCTHAGHGEAIIWYLLLGTDERRQSFLLSVYFFDSENIAWEYKNALTYHSSRQKAFSFYVS